VVTAVALRWRQSFIFMGVSGWVMEQDIRLLVFANSVLQVVLSVSSWVAGIADPGVSAAFALSGFLILGSLLARSSLEHEASRAISGVLLFGLAALPFFWLVFYEALELGLASRVAVSMMFTLLYLVYPAAAFTILVEARRQSKEKK
jgi:hypothetical protein